MKVSHEAGDLCAGPPRLLPRIIALPLAVALATASGVVVWSEGTDQATWAAVHTDPVLALGIVVLVRLAVYLHWAVQASAKSLAASAATRLELVIVWALLAALVAGAIATGLEPTWNPSAPHRLRGPLSRGLPTLERRVSLAHAGC